MSQTRKVLYKIIVLGDTKVGKTQLVNRFMGLEFSKKHDPTVVADMNTTCVVKDKVEFNLQIWDTPGNAAALESLGDRNLAADGCMLVYSVLMKRTIKCLEERLEAYRNACKSAGNEVGEIILVGNMADKTSKVPFEKVQIWASQQGIDNVVEVSAFKDDGVTEAFHTIMKAPKQDDLLEIADPNFNVSNRRRPVGSSSEVIPKAKWLPDSSAKDCACCGEAFSLFLRRSHCRACGDVVCKNCCGNQWDYGGQIEKTCDDCFAHFDSEAAAMNFVGGGQ